MARFFNGTNTNIIFGNVGPPTGNTPWSLSVFIRPIPTGNPESIWASAGGLNGNLEFRVDSSGQLGIIKQNVSEPAHSYNYVTWAKWQHVLVSYDGVSLSSFYINGASAGVFSAAISFTNGPNNNVIGANDNSGTEYFKGGMRDLSLYNVALTSSEAGFLSRGRSPLGVRKSGLLCYYLLDGIAATEHDWSGNGNNSTNVNGGFTTDSDPPQVLSRQLTVIPPIKSPPPPPLVFRKSLSVYGTRVGARQPHIRPM